MGRMADARKRAKRTEPSPDATPVEAVPVNPPASEPEESRDDSDFTFPPEEPVAAPASPAAPEPAPTTWVTREEPWAAPEPPRSPAPKTKIVLPPSGLASDILALAESASVPAAPAPTTIDELAPLADTPSEPARTHNISFFAAPVRDERKAVEATEHLASFFLAGEEYAVDVRMVQEIIRVTEITQVPRAPAFIKGVINLRGRIIPVVDLKRKLGLGDVEVTKNARIVVVKLRDRLIGLLVDGASQVLKVPLSAIDAAPDEVSDIEAGAIRGVAKLQDRLIILMDLSKILTPELREGTPSA
jgi:purine-binding chemotaxis protein CheW